MWWELRATLPLVARLVGVEADTASDLQTHPIGRTGPITEQVKAPTIRNTGRGLIRELQIASKTCHLGSPDYARQPIQSASRYAAKS